MGGCVSSRKGGVQGAAEKYLQLEPGKKSSTAARVSHYIDVTSNDPEEQHRCHASTVACISPAGRLAARALCLPMPLYQLLFTMIYKLYDIAPKNLVRCIFGVCLTFFGGTYVASLAAIEAFRKMGGERAWADVYFVYEQTQLVNLAQPRDEEMGRAGEAPSLLAPADAARRKFEMAMSAVRTPGKVESIIGSLWAAYLAVLATLSLQFAQTTALALGIAEVIRFPVTRALTPLLAMALGGRLRQWVGTIIRTSTCLLCIVFAWYVKVEVAAVYSALRGGQMFADSLFAMIAKSGLVGSMHPRLASVFVADDSFLDEALGFLLAAVGLYAQLYSSFALVFPLNLGLLPLDGIEWFLRYHITFGTAGSAAP